MALKRRIKDLVILFVLGFGLLTTTQVGTQSQAGVIPLAALSSDLIGGATAPVTLTHCCHAHPYPPYDRYCCHDAARPVYVAPGPSSVRAQSRRVSRRTSRRVSRRR